MVAAILIPGSDISLENVLLNSGRIEFAHILKQMGADIEFRPETSFIEAAGTIKVRYSPQLKAANICNDSIIKCIDELPVLAVAMSFAEGVSRIRDAMELRKKESDRITAICTALKEIGIKIRELPDGFEIVGNPDLVPYGTCKTFSDHRIAAALSIFALKSKSGIELDDIDCIDVSFPEFKNNFLPCFGSFV
jgi:3-phosphoshikimate 1-carboxyvinyltransferase